MKIIARVFDIDGRKMSAGIDLDLFMQNQEELQFPATEESLPLKDFLYFRKEYSDWMLSTGRKDKNGMEIFEGDIVNTPAGSRFIIVYDFDRWKFKGDDKYRPYAVAKWQWDAVEVVGNIHENIITAKK